MLGKRNILFVVIAIILAVSLFSWMSVLKDAPQHSDDEVVQDGPSVDTTTDERTANTRFVEHSSSNIPERSTLSVGSQRQILRDVSDKNLDHRALESFLTKRPMGAYRIVEIDSNELQARIRESEESSIFEIALISETPVRLIAKSADEFHSGWRTGQSTWLGKVDDDEVSSARFLVAPDSTVNATIRSVEFGRIKIEPIPSTPYHIVWTMDPSYTRKID